MFLTTASITNDHYFHLHILLFIENHFLHKSVTFLLYHNECKIMGDILLFFVFVFALLSLSHCEILPSNNPTGPICGQKCGRCCWLANPTMLGKHAPSMLHCWPVQAVLSLDAGINFCCLGFLQNNVTLHAPRKACEKKVLSFSKYARHAKVVMSTQAPKLSHTSSSPCLAWYTKSTQHAIMITRREKKSNWFFLFHSSPPPLAPFFTVYFLSFCGFPWFCWDVHCLY